ncbi:MAG: 3-dehydroquinate synthase [Epsilonproteobacteria bacterium]|nr:3-dehydroquinate synthase [Campylobacterota bacterium]OIO15074.1 MAG: 3-dehydroquinate synthase [Helicobacteraceae bacterium CG1_02_36_14]PIP11020.1 MAG: 3-dehydroquinate synthase [Sulfurimonas sp. CG23_combo_of_CG06-09_8_20_14_all_36_33]PIS25405.1 MAG: 3-dehydroquinate synthase [Sulfurimonas sp. CG08_land_8_20_14_0_20_36_33]PIU36098.1 MAG: 3-dehydroquinate synthase [Sulfurimonas sp. CG07_land_8_20_14_0_80_36_56]PIV02397.1 MAG: 3-dehydroquinate synthase [Sulfurimonas sp. CG03_land_8_20_14_0
MQVEILLKKVVDNSYNITIDALPQIHFDRKVAIVTNPKVAGLHLAYLLSKISAKEIYIITVPDGEEYKNQKSIDTILDSLFNHRFNRNSMLIAFGGGVIGDMTGYAASIFQRGVDFIQIPTTLLSQVDASVGGKTGMNNAYGKNLVGAFHQPKSVYIDSHFLTTLPSREFGAGVAEIVKMAVTFNKDFFEFLESADLRDAAVLKEVIQQAVQTKANVVAEDEKEHGLRAALNYGHTFGHVIESETNYKTFLHGEAVAIGMVMANETAVAMEYMSRDEAQRVKTLLEKYDLPTSYIVKNPDAFYETFYLDKKSSDSAITFILPIGIGDVTINSDIKVETILSVLNKFGEL